MPVLCLYIMQIALCKYLLYYAMYNHSNYKDIAIFSDVYVNKENTYCTNFYI